MECKIGKTYEVENYSEVEGEYAPDYWYQCPACGYAYNVQLSTDAPPKSPFNCKDCDTPVILCEEADESD